MTSVSLILKGALNPLDRQYACSNAMSCTSSGRCNDAMFIIINVTNAQPLQQQQCAAPSITHGMHRAILG